ncbi:hypothetical protein QMO56_04455 [Roseomonas sp. E05]|uniref:hypothetical protein n=1 Tax=Roseomonas sp. E05 TaxID=3046310 RepID=UPI0024B8B80B|nr:hypothetical protein [Roseomonas sp. E05]MDJ0387355.1 hypothetical protein [Roseomonas sp. E05]
MQSPSYSPGFLAAPALRLVGPGFAERVLTSRPGTAWAMNASGTWQAVAPDTPRFQGSARRLLVEEARSNALPNPRAEGAEAGTPGALPTGWSILGTEALTRTVVGTGTIGGVPYIDLRYSGSLSNAQSWWVLFTSITTVPAAAGEVWSASANAYVVAGSLANLSASLSLMQRTSTGGYISGVSSAPGGLPGYPEYRSVSREMAAGTGRVIAGLLLQGLTPGAGADVTIRIAGPQLELGPFASSLVLPPAGSPGATPRAADLPIWTPAGGFGSQGTVLLRAMLPNAALFGRSQGLFQIDDGTDQNRLLVRNTSGGAVVYGVVDSAGATLAALEGGSVTPGVPFQAAFAWAPGDQAFCLNGGTVQTAAASLPGGLTRMLVGHASGALNRAANGEVALLDYRPQRLPNAMLQALSAAA